MAGPKRAAHGRPAARTAAPEVAEYLQRILTARVYDVAVESPLERAASLSARLGNEVWLKREDSQPVFSFKLRGAYNKMAHLSHAELSRGVICASAGNHAQGVALSARRLGCKALVVMPVTTPQVKVEAVKALGGEAVLFGDSYSDAYAHAQELERERRLTFVHPFDDPDVIAGQGTIAMEVLRQHQGPIDAIFVAIGGGGLISGVAAYIKAVRPEIKVIGVQMSDSDAMVRSVRAGKRVELHDVGPVFGRHRRQAGRQGDISPRAQAGGRLRRRRHRCSVRRNQGCFPGHAQHPRACRRARRRGNQAVRRSTQGQGADLHCDHHAART